MDLTYTEMPALNRIQAASILNRMGETGQPPEYGLEFITVGIDPYLYIVEHEYLERLIKRAKGSAFRLVQGSYGCGKTHFLYCVRSLAQRLGFLTCTVNLSPKECPYEDTVKVYKAIFDNIACKLPEEYLEEGSGCYKDTVYGFSDILRLFAKGKLKTENPAPSFSEVSVENYAFRTACCEFVKACREGRADDEELLEYWLSGETQVTGEGLRRLGIFESISYDNAFPAMRSLISMVLAMGFPGVVFLFDEVDLHTSGTSKKHLRAMGDNLRRLIDLCASSAMPGVMFFYAVPPEFLNFDITVYPALQQRLMTPLAMSKSSPQSVVIDLEKISVESREFLYALGERLIMISARAWDWNPHKSEIMADNLRRFVDFAEEHVFTGGYRLFVKFWIAVLFEQYGGGIKPLSEENFAELLQL